MISEFQKLLVFENDLIARHGYYSVGGKLVHIGVFVERAKTLVEPLALDAESAPAAPAAPEATSIVLTCDAALDVATGQRFAMRSPVCILFARSHAHAHAMLRTALSLIAPNAADDADDAAVLYVPDVPLFRTARLEKMPQPLWVSVIVAPPTAAADMGGLLQAAAARGHREVVVGVSRDDVYEFDAAILKLTSAGPLAGAFSQIVLSSAAV
jgi:hypothetical protein